METLEYESLLAMENISLLNMCNNELIPVIFNMGISAPEKFAVYATNCNSIGLRSLWITVNFVYRISMRNLFFKMRLLIEVLKL